MYLAAVFTQNGSAVLVAILTDRYFGDLGITLVSIGFTLVYFVVVEAMSKTYAILHSDRVALAVAPFVWVVGRTLCWPTRLLIGVANVLLPGKGLKSGPFVMPGEIRTMADVGLEEGSIAGHEREMIHSVFELGGPGRRRGDGPASRHHRDRGDEAAAGGGRRDGHARRVAPAGLSR